MAISGLHYSREASFDSVRKLLWVEIDVTGLSGGG